MAAERKRPPTSGTRHGVGAGWGGAPKGAGNRGAGPGRPKGVKTGEGAKSVADLMVAAGARELAAQRWVEILSDPAHPKHAEMVFRAADRMDGAPKTSIQITERDPNSMTDAELAAIASRGRGAASSQEDAAE